MYFTINEKVNGITISKKPGGKDEVHEILNIIWECNTFYPCSIADYGIAHAIKDFDASMDSHCDEMGISNPRNCFILSFSESDGDSVNLICALDPT
jgi:hypothetical protein